jgi:ADP-ribosyl-[dinitrogen reductase] hydrolase
MPEDTPTQPCPICGTQQRANPRYPRYVCPACTARAVDDRGRPVQAYNTHVMGHGVQVLVTETGENTGTTTLFIDGIACHAAEARFGGIVIQPRE